MLSIYNCSQLPAATYNVFEPATKLITNANPYCAELFNPRWVQFAAYFRGWYGLWRSGVG